MPTPEKQVRVFISSTFRDMHAERDHLVTVVFPELRERVEQLGLEFFDVDLRWGVPAKDLNGETANSWEYCRQWIDRVEPFFLCILGQRYGWVPEPRHFRDDADRRRQQREPRSITDLEVRHAVLDTRRKRRSYFYLRATPVPEPNADYMDPPEYQGRLEQLKTAVRHCGRPVRNYTPEWTGQGFVGLKEFGDFVLDDLWSGVLRDERYVPKEVWRQVLNADPDTDPRYTDESQPVPRELWEKIVALAKPPPQDPLDAERQQMEAFAASRLRWFQGRTHELRELAGFIYSTAEDAPRLAVVAAVPGQGKSALIAKLSTLISQPSTFLITHFVGATERSATVHTLVQRLLDELDRSDIEWPPDEQKEGVELKRDFNSLCNRLRQRLGDFAGDRRIVIVLDALNQLTDGHNLVWLPNRLGPSVRIVVSCVDCPSPAGAGEGDRRPGEGLTAEQQVLGALERWKDTSLRVHLGELSPDDVRTIVVEYLREYCHELDREHLDALCAIPQTRNPLYLLVMLNELRTLGGNDLNVIVPARIASMSREYPNTVALFRWVLERLEVFGSEAVRWWCLYLAHGRVGMASHELADLLALKLASNAAATALLIERGLRRYLLQRGGQLDFFHRQLRQAVVEEYGPHVEAVVVHGELADYFTACARGSDPQKEWETDSGRGFAECVFHCTKAQQHDQAAALLTHFPFLFCKLRMGLLEGVFRDYELVRREAPPAAAGRLENWYDFFREKAHMLRRGREEWPAHKILLQLAVEHADDSPLTIGAEQWLGESRYDRFWLRRMPRPPHTRKNSCVLVLEGHGASVVGAVELPGGRLATWATDRALRIWCAQTGACLVVLEQGLPLSPHFEDFDVSFSVLALSDARLVSWAESKQPHVWDAQSGALIATLEGHTAPVNGALELTGGRVLSWSRDHSLRVWDARSGACLITLSGHRDKVAGALALSDGRVLSWSRDNTLRIWDAQTGICQAVLEGHTDSINGALELSDNRLLSWSPDRTLRLWDGHNGASLAVLEGHQHSIWGVLALAGGRLLSWSIDCSLRVWDARSGAPFATLNGHTREVRGARELSDGRLLSWSNDMTLRVWEAQSGACLAVLEGHTDCVEEAFELSDGRLLSWSEDRRLRLWDARDGACLRVIEAHTTYRLNGATELSDGRLLSWSVDGTLRLWDLRGHSSGKPLDGHTGYVRRALVLPDGRILSWSWEHKLRIWDGQSGQRLAVLRGHSDRVEGALALPNGKILSWSPDKTLRLWDGQSGQCLAVLQGHSDRVKAALVLPNGRILSWSPDKTLRLWDGQSGQCLAVLRGHSDRVEGALVLHNGKILSWASTEDNTPRIWDGQSGQCLAVLEGHSVSVKAAQILADGRILSWSWDKTLRIWDGQSGQRLAVLRGHSDGVEGALALPNGKILSWSPDKTLRLWDGQSGQCFAVLEGHSKSVRGAQVMPDGRILSWSWDRTLRLWDGQSGACLKVVAEDDAARLHPDWLHAIAKAEPDENVLEDFRLESPARTAHLRHRNNRSPLAVWNADSFLEAHCLSAAGTAVVTQRNAQICFLKLHHGNRHISLADAEELIKLRSQESEVRSQKADMSAKPRPNS